MMVLISLDGVAPSQIVGVSAFVIFLAPDFFFCHWLARVVTEKGP